jgi:hypothetical protein
MRISAAADVLTPQQVTESLTAATGRKFTAAVLDAQTFQTKRPSRVQCSNQRIQREDLNSSATSRTEEWLTLEP